MGVTRSRSPIPSTFALAASVAAAAGLAALALGATLPASTWAPLMPSSAPVPPGAPIAAVALMTVGAAILARRVSEATAFTLLALACVGAGLAARTASHALGAGGGATGFAAEPLPTLLADAGMFWLSCLILTAWAAAPGRALGRWVAPLGVGIALLAVLGSLVRAGASIGDPATSVGTAAAALPGWTYQLSLVWRSGVTIAVPALLGVIGTLRADALRYLAGGRSAPPSRPELGAGRVFWLAAVATGVGWVVGMQFPDVGPPYGGGLPALFWLLVAAVAIRWSGYLGWSALAASLVLGAERALVAAETAALGTVDGARPLGEPMASPAWGPAIVAGWTLIALATWAGWRAWLAADPGSRTARGRWAGLAGTLAVPATTILAGVPVLATFILWAPPAGWPIPDAWTPFVVLGPVVVGAIALLRRRLVPAMAEAETAPDGGSAPSRYLSVLATELVTGEARIRAATAEAERARLASDLHAEVLPILAQAADESAAGAPPERIVERLRAVEADVRGLLSERRLLILEEFGVVRALEWLAEHAQQRADLDVDVVVDDSSTEERPPRAVERAGFRIAQLATDNALQHARATRLRLDVLVRADRLLIRVADDGVGLGTSVGPGAASADHYGMADMRFQADQVRGRLEVSEVSTGGTAVTFDWPTS